MYCDVAEHEENIQLEMAYRDWLVTKAVGRRSLFRIFLYALYNCTYITKLTDPIQYIEMFLELWPNPTVESLLKGSTCLRLARQFVQWPCHLVFYLHEINIDIFWPSGSRHELLVTSLKLEGKGHKTFNCSASSDLGTRTLEVTVSGRTTFDPGSVDPTGRCIR